MSLCRDLKNQVSKNAMGLFWVHRRVSGVDYQAQFEKLLGYKGDSEVFLKLQSKYLARYKFVAKHGNAEAAIELYNEASHYPGQSTISALREHSHLFISDPFPTGSVSASFFYANDTETGALKIVKYPIHKHAERELKICQDLKLDTLQLGDPCSLTPVEIRNVPIRQEGAGRRSITVMVMPQFGGTLVGKWAAPHRIFVGAKSIIQALNYIHKAGLVHMDVKGDNIFIDVDGNWYLGDFGSCVPVNTPITSYTRMFYWKHLNISTIPPEVPGSAPIIPPNNAEFRYDWNMLAVAIIMHLAELQWKSLVTKKTGIETVDENLLLEAIEKVEHVQLKALLLQLMKHTDSQLVI